MLGSRAPANSADVDVDTHGQDRTVRLRVRAEAFTRLLAARTLDLAALSDAENLLDLDTNGSGSVEREA